MRRIFCRAIGALGLLLVVGCSNSNDDALRTEYAALLQAYASATASSTATSTVTLSETVTASTTVTASSASTSITTVY